MTQRPNDDNNTVPRIGLASAASSLLGFSRDDDVAAADFSSSSEDFDRPDRNFDSPRPCRVGRCGRRVRSSDRGVIDPTTARRVDPGVSETRVDRAGVNEPEGRRQQRSDCTTSRNARVANLEDDKRFSPTSFVLCGTSSVKRGRPTLLGSVKSTTATTKTVIRTLSDTVRGSGSDSEAHHRHRVGVVKLGSGTATEMTKGNGARGAGDLSGPSVLRALLQSSGKQACVYQSQHHPLDARRPSSRPAPGRSGIQHAAGSGALAVAAAGHRSRRRSPVQPDEGHYHRKEETRSEIKALLMGQVYQRVPPTNAAAAATLAIGSCSSDDVVDLSRRGSRAVAQDSLEGGRGSRWSPPRSSPSAKRLRLDNSQTHVIFQEHSLSNFLVQVVDLVNEFEDLVYSVQRGIDYSSVEVRRRGLYGVPALGLTPAQVIVEGSGYAHFVTAVATSASVNSVQCRDGRDRLSESTLRPLLFKLSASGGHVFCPGVAPDLVVQSPAAAAASRGLTHVELGPSLGWSQRYQAKDCPVWFYWPQTGANQGRSPLDELVHKCKLCSVLERGLKSVKQEKMEVDNGGQGAGAGTIVMMDDGRSEYVCVWRPDTAPSDGEEEAVLAETLH